MHHTDLEPWQHAHTFGQDVKRPAESRTLAIVGLTAVTMVVEVGAGLLFGSMALLADGLHMASHAAALGINAFAYSYARRHADSPLFSFGTGKVNALGGFTGAVLLATFAALMAWESLQRLLHPVTIAYNQAILVAIFGLAVNGISVLVLGERESGHSDDHTDRSARAHSHERDADHNLRSAYLHVLADALTSVLAIGALASAKYFGAIWVDPAVGIFGAILIARWSVALLQSSNAVLLDRQAPEYVSEAVRTSIESDGDSRVADLHVWLIGPGTYAATIIVVAAFPSTPAQYRERLPRGLGLEHVSIEVCHCDDEHIDLQGVSPNKQQQPRRLGR